MVPDAGCGCPGCSHVGGSHGCSGLWSSCSCWFLYGRRPEWAAAPTHKWYVTSQVVTMPIFYVLLPSGSCCVAVSSFFISQSLVVLELSRVPGWYLVVPSLLLFPLPLASFFFFGPRELQFEGSRRVQMPRGLLSSFRIQRLYLISCHSQHHHRRLPFVTSSNHHVA